MNNNIVISDKGLEEFCWKVIEDLINMGVIDSALSMDRLGEATILAAKGIRKRQSNNSNYINKEIL
jgi:hypothetical protein